MIGATFPAVYGLVGYPLGHSLSPRIHGAALETLGLPGTYVALPVPADRLAGAVAGVRAWRLPGLNVTIPHKVAVMALLDGVTPLATEIGAVNTLYWKDDRLLGDNTDYVGFLASLPPCALEGAEVTVLGAGGAARAVVLALRDRGVRHVHVVARRLAAADALRDQLLGGVDGPCAGRIARFEDLIDDESLLGRSRLVVNATPIGMHGDVSPLHRDQLAMLPDDAVVFDLIYHPDVTPLMRATRASGREAVGGLEMLVQQAAASFKRWTGQEPPLEVMRLAALAGLPHHHGESGRMGTGPLMPAFPVSEPGEGV